MEWSCWILYFHLKWSSSPIPPTTMRLIGNNTVNIPGSHFSCRIFVISSSMGNPPSNPCSNICKIKRRSKHKSLDSTLIHTLSLASVREIKRPASASCVAEGSCRWPCQPGHDMGLFRSFCFVFQSDSLSYHGAAGIRVETCLGDLPSCFRLPRV